MRAFKIHYPIPLVDDTIIDDNVDFYIIFQTGEVYFGLAATPENLRTLLDKKERSYFWDEDLIVLPDLRKSTIRTAVQEALDGLYFESMFTYIGILHDIWVDLNLRFDDIDDPTFVT